MANIRAGVAYIDVRLGSIERFKNELREKLAKTGQESGEKIGTELGEGITRGSNKSVPEAAKKVSDRFSKRFGENLVRSGQILRVGLIAWLLPAAVAAGPFIGAVIGAGIVAGIPVAVIAGGIALIAKDKRITKAWEGLTTTIEKDMTKATGSFVKPTLDAIKLLRDAWKANFLDIRAIFTQASTFIIPLTQGITEGLSYVIQGIRDVVTNAGPVIQILSDGFARLGKAIGEMLTKITSDPEAVKGMGDALEDLIGILVLVIGWFGNFIVSASRAYSQFKESWGAIKTWFSSVIVPSLKRSADQAVAAWNGFSKWINSLPGWFRDRWNSLVGIVSSALSRCVGVTLAIGARIISAALGITKSVTNAFTSLPGRLYSAGVSAMMGFFNGIASIGGRVIQKARDIASSVVSTIKGALQIFSPSRVMEKLGVFTGEGFVQGLDKSMPDLAAISKNFGVPSVGIDFGSPKEPQMDKDANAALSIENYYANDQIDPWRQAEDWYFMVSARGGVA